MYQPLPFPCQWGTTPQLAPAGCSTGPSCTGSDPWAQGCEPGPGRGAGLDAAEALWAAGTQPTAGQGWAASRPESGPRLSCFLVQVLSTKINSLLLLPPVSTSFCYCISGTRLSPLAGGGNVLSKDSCPSGLQWWLPECLTILSPKAHHLLPKPGNPSNASATRLKERSLTLHCTF